MADVALQPNRVAARKPRANAPAQTRPAQVDNRLADDLAADRADPGSWSSIRRSTPFISATLNKRMDKFVGLSNFTFLFTRETFWMVVRQSCIFAVTAVVFKALIGFIVAHFVHNVPVNKQRRWRGMLLIPWVIPAAMSTLAWLWLFDPSHSAFNSRRRSSGRHRPGAVDRQPQPARFAVILVNIWIGSPFFMIMYLAALKSVPEQLYEAAASSTRLHSAGCILCVS